MKFFVVKVDQFIGGYDPVETIHLIATDQDIVSEVRDLLTGLWIDRDKEIQDNYVVFGFGHILCELSSIKEIDEQTFDLLQGLGL